MPEYFKDLVDAKKTLARYKRYARESERQPGGGYSRWMYGRRVSDYVRFVVEQSQGIHNEAAGIDGLDFCTCGLFAADENTQIQRTFGHLQDGELTTLLIHDFDDGKGNELYCQNCRQCWPVIYKDGEFFFDEPLIDWEATKAQHPGCVRIEGSAGGVN